MGYVATCDICVPTAGETVAVKPGDTLDMADAGTIESMVRMGQAVKQEEFVPPAPEPTTTKRKSKTR